MKNTNNKRALYESIMNKVSKVVKEALNEGNGNSITVKATLKNIDQHKTSYLGNPSWRVVALTEDGEIIEGRTSANDQLGYAISRNWIGDDVELTYHVLNSGRVVIDSITH